MWQLFPLLVEFGISLAPLNPSMVLVKKNLRLNTFPQGTHKAGTISYLSNIHGDDQGILKNFLSPSLDLVEFALPIFFLFLTFFAP